MRIIIIAAALAASTPSLAASQPPLTTERAHAEAAAVAAEHTARDFLFMVAMTTKGPEGNAAARRYLQIARQQKPKAVVLAAR